MFEKKNVRVGLEGEVYLLKNERQRDPNKNNKHS